MTVRVHSILSAIPEHLPKELCQTLWLKDNFRIERLISRGHCSPDGFWYDQAQDEWVLLLQGSARLQIKAQDDIAMTAGDYVLLPAHCQHRVSWTDADVDCIWLAVFVD